MLFVTFKSLGCLIWEVQSDEDDTTGENWFLLGRSWLLMAVLGRICSFSLSLSSGSNATDSLFDFKSPEDCLLKLLGPVIGPLGFKIC